MLKIIDEAGKEWEFCGEYRYPVEKEYFLTCSNPDFGPSTVARAGQELRELRAIVYPIHKRYTFGGVEFEDTGEYRPVRAGEWYLVGNLPWVWYADSLSTGGHHILRVVH